jgi:MYXO-CTERM domain-containing protein
MPLPFPLSSDPLTLAAIPALALLAAAALFVRRRRPWLSHIQRKPLLTPNEAEFFHRLRRALPDYAVFPQVAFGALLADDGKLSGNARWSVRARFDRKIADFVICDRRTLAVIVLVELDDRTHDPRADRQRNAITRAAGYQTLRFQSQQKPTDAELAELFRHARAWQEGN